MPCRIVKQTSFTQTKVTPPGILSTLLFCCASFIFPSTSHAETADDLAAKLSKLGYAQAEAVARVPNYRVDGWNYLDDRHIMIYAGPSKRFLITTLVDCPDLSSAEHIGFTSTTSYLTKFDKLIVRGAGDIVQNCPINEIRILNKPATK